MKKARHKYSTQLPGQQARSAPDPASRLSPNTTSSEAVQVVDDQQQKAAVDNMAPLARSEASRPNSRFKEPPPVLPQKSLLKGRPAYGFLESVEEEAGSNVSLDAKRASMADSVQTVLYRPVTPGEGDTGGVKDLAGGSGGSDQNGTASKTSSDESYETPESASRHSLESLSRTTIEDDESPASAGTDRRQNPDNGQRSLRRVAKLPEQNIHDLLAPPGTEPITSSSHTQRIGRNEQQSRADQLALRKQPATKNGKTSDVNIPTTRPEKLSSTTEKHFSKPFSPHESEHDEPKTSSRSEKRPPVRARYYRTVRDGVPILMHQRSGVWVETVEGVDLTTFQGSQQRQEDPPPIPVQEAAEVRNIELPDRSSIDASSVPSAAQRQSESSSRDEHSKDSGYGSTTAARRSSSQTDTERWARTQADLQQADNKATVIAARRDRPDSGHRLPANIEAKIDQLAADAEAMIYGGMPKRDGKSQMLNAQMMLEQLDSHRRV